MSYAWLFIWYEGGLAELTGDEQYAAKRAKYWLNEGAGGTMQVVRLDRNTLDTKEYSLTRLAKELDEE